MDKPLPQFKVTKIMDVGADHPIVKRLLLQFSHIIESGLIDLPNSAKDRVKALLFDLVQHMLRTEEALHHYAELEDTALKRLAEVKNEHDRVYSFDDPTLELTKHFENFLIHAVIGVRDTCKMASAITGEKITGPKDLITSLARVFTADTAVLEWLEDNKNWGKQLFDLRALSEHGGLDVQRFDVIGFKDDAPVVRLPQLATPYITLREYLNQTWPRLFFYCEDTVALLLSTKCKFPGVIVDLPENQWESRGGRRYVIELGYCVKQSQPEP